MVLLVILVAISVVQLWLLRTPEGTSTDWRRRAVAAQQPLRPRHRATTRPASSSSLSCSWRRSPGRVLSAFKPSQRGTPAAAAALADDGLQLAELRHLDAFGAGIWTIRREQLYVSLVTVVLTVVVSLLAGYGFSRFRFPFKNVLFVLIISTVMIPFQSILTPLFLMLTKLGLHNTLPGSSASM